MATSGGSSVFSFFTGGGTSGTGGSWSYPNLNLYVGSKIYAPGSGIPLGAKITSYDQATGRAIIDTSTTSASPSGGSTINIIKIVSDKIATTELKVDYIKQTNGVLYLYFNSSAFNGSSIGVSNSYRLSVDNNNTNTVQIIAAGSTNEVNSLNLQSKTISVTTDWSDTIGSSVYSCIELANTGASDIPLTNLTNATVYIKIPLPSNSKTLVVYPEDVAIATHTLGIEGGYSPTTLYTTFSDNLVVSNDRYYAWGGAEYPLDSKFSIKLDASNNATISANSFVGTATNASKIDNRKIYVQTATPAGASVGDIWLKV